MFVIMYSIGDKDYEHSRYLDVEDAYAEYDNLDFDTFDDAWVERVEE